jgi:hypothetical protein
MSEFARAQISVLMKRASEVIRKSQEIRRELDGVMKRIEEKNAAKRKADFSNSCRLAAHRDDVGALWMRRRAMCDSTCWKSPACSESRRQLMYQ